LHANLANTGDFGTRPAQISAIYCISTLTASFIITHWADDAVGIDGCI